MEIEELKKGQEKVELINEILDEEEKLFKKLSIYLKQHDK